MIHIYTSVSSSTLLPCPFRFFYGLFWFHATASVSWRSCAERRAESPSAHFYQPVSRRPAVQLVANHSLSAGACLNLLLIENVRWSLLCRSDKVRGWHFNCAYVIYGARRASLALLNTFFFFLVLYGCQIQWEIRKMAIFGGLPHILRQTAVVLCALARSSQCFLSSRMTARCDFYPLRLNSALTCWLWPGTSWWLYSIIRICCDSLHGNDSSFLACSLQHVENRLRVPTGPKKRLHCV